MYNGRNYCPENKTFLLKDQEPFIKLYFEIKDKKEEI